MTKPKNPAAVALGKLTSPRKAESSRQNGKKGGRKLSDICECGDYRSQHDSDGPCRICRHHMNPWDDCSKFRLSHHASPAELEHWQQSQAKD